MTMPALDTVESTAGRELAGGELDRDAMARLERFGGAKLLDQMIDLFIANGIERLDAARTAALAGDRDGVRKALHALKSSAGQMGAVKLQSMCEKGESLAANGVAGPLPDLVAAAYWHYVAAVRVLQYLKPVVAGEATGTGR